RAAERKLLRRSEVLRRTLAGNRQQRAKAVADALQAPGIEVVFGERAERVVTRGPDVESEHAGRRDAEFAARSSERIGIETAAEGSVAEVAHQAILPVADLALFQRALRLDAVDELLVFVGELQDDVGVARAHDRMEEEGRFHLALAVRIQAGEILCQAIFEFRPAHAEARAPVAQR